MVNNSVKLKKVFEKTDGRCHICHDPISFKNYGINGKAGVWHVDHSKPVSKGGSSHLNNLLPACIPCNLSKSNSSTKAARAKNGQTRAPLNASTKQQIKTKNTVGGAFIGGVIGSIFGPVGIAIGSSIGGAIGHENSPKS